MKIQSLGAMDTVTGSKHLVHWDEHCFLFDAGFFQGGRDLEKRNYNVKISAQEIEAVFLSHAHLDHCGYLPKLVKDGFNGPIFCTENTRLLMELVLNDAANLMIHSKKHKTPLYHLGDVIDTLKRVKVVTENKIFEWKDFSVQYFLVGHILGASAIRVEKNNKSILYTGDLGRSDDQLMPPFSFQTTADYILSESTYGDRCHEKIDYEDYFFKIFQRVVKENKVLVIPAFSIGRSQTLFKIINQVLLKHPEFSFPVYAHSPMMQAATKIYQKNIPELSEITKIQFIEHSNHAASLQKKTGPMVILSSGGMCSGGPVQHHLEAFAPDANNIILLVGYQSIETVGRDLLDGKKEIQLGEKTVAVLAKVEFLKGLSAHADQKQILQVLKNITGIKEIILVHGESLSKNVLAEYLKKELNHKVRVMGIDAIEL
jgi:metallo-beta-lactamase family protein